MTTYALLQADIASWTARTDMGGQLATFIRIAEADISRAVRVSEQETAITLSLTSGANYTATLPTGFLGFKHVFVSGSINPTAQYLPPSQFHVLKNTPQDAFNALSGGSFVYTIEDNSVKGYASPGSTTAITLDTSYVKRFDALSDTNTTNWLLTNHYDIYIYATLKVTWDFIDETEQIAKYQGLLDRAIEQLYLQETRKRTPPGPLTRRPPAVVY